MTVRLNIVSLIIEIVNLIGSGLAGGLPDQYCMVQDHSVLVLGDCEAVDPCPCCANASSDVLLVRTKDYTLRLFSLKKICAADDAN